MRLSLAFFLATLVPDPVRPLHLRRSGDGTGGGRGGGEKDGKPEAEADALFSNDSAADPNRRRLQPSATAASCTESSEAKFLNTMSNPRTCKWLATRSADRRAKECSNGARATCPITCGMCTRPLIPLSTVEGRDCSRDRRCGLCQADCDSGALLVHERCSFLLYFCSMIVVWAIPSYILAPNTLSSSNAFESLSHPCISCHYIFPIAVVRRAMRRRPQVLLPERRSARAGMRRYRNARAGLLRRPCGREQCLCW